MMMRKQGGFGLVEGIAALGLLAIASVGALKYVQQQADEYRYSMTASQYKEVSKAAEQYLKDNYAAIGSVATPNKPAEISLSMLKNADYLSSSFPDQNPFGQTYKMLAVEPAADKLDTLVITTDGEDIPEIGLRKIASSIGATGGYVSDSSPTVVTGAYKGWSAPLATYGISSAPGHIASSMYLADGALVSDYLYRKSVPGHPELNTMSTDLGLANNDINGANAISTKSLAATGDVSSNRWVSSSYGGGWYMQDSSWLRSIGNKGVYTGGEIKGGKVTADGRLTANEYLQLNKAVTENSSCSPNGLVARDSAGKVLSCQSGAWKSISSTASYYITAGTTGGSGLMRFSQNDLTCKNSARCVKNSLTHNYSCPTGTITVPSGEELYYLTTSERTVIRSYLCLDN